MDMNTIQASECLLWMTNLWMRRILKQILAQHPDIQLVGEASTGDEAVAAVANVQPDIVVMDIRMPKMDGVAAAREIKARHPEVKIVGLSEHEGYHEHAMEVAGAAGTLRKSAATEELYEIIRRVAKG